MGQLNRVKNWCIYVLKSIYIVIVPHLLCFSFLTCYYNGRRGYGEFLALNLMRINDYNHEWRRGLNLRSKIYSVYKASIKTLFYILLAYNLITPSRYFIISPLLWAAIINMNLFNSFQWQHDKEQIENYWTFVCFPLFEHNV